ncbi:MAG: hypothetical protein J6B54_01465 [Clostridia bacterium]|nr:hypothetical protein [Clostridia bacterium]
MSRRFLQSTFIVIVFLLAVAAVLFLGIREGKTASLKVHGVKLDEKTPWNDALTDNAFQENSVVYVTESGSKYHRSAQCPALKQAKQVIGVPLSAAMEDGKDPCSRCGK